MASTSKQQARGQHVCEGEADVLFTRVSGHIYELYRPNEGPAQLEILFFHGLQLGNTSEAYFTTWTNENNELWPAIWLPRKLPQVRILSVSYDASMRKTSKQGRFDLYNVAENLTYDIRAARIGQTTGCPVILVGHCFGGLVIKDLCVKAEQQKMKDFLRNLKGIFFYGTPHIGTHFVDVVSRFLDGSLLDHVMSLNKVAARLDGEFRSVCQKLWLEKKIASVGESHKTKILGMFDAVMVPEASARYGDYLYTLDADHFTICKPIMESSPGFKILLEFILSIKPEEYVIPDNFQWLPREAIGLDLKVEKILKMLKETTTVGIVGMGGIGKTTLAKAVFNKLCSSFDFTCFVREVKLISGGAVAKEERINKLMCYMGKQASGIAWLRKRLLLVFDDIGDDADINAFSEVIHKAAPGSLCVITTRDEGLLTRLGDVKLYRMPFLTHSDAEELLKSYVFSNELIIPSYLGKHVQKIIEKCEGLPLAVEVLGQCLKRKKGRNDEKFWVQMATALELADKYPRFDRMWGILRYSYDALNVAQQGMFLDATTFFAGGQGQEQDMFHSWNLREAKAAWSKVYEGCEEILWDSLVDASLVYAVEEDDKIQVHEQLKSLGRKIAREDRSCRRVWNEDEGLQALRFVGAPKYQGIECLRIWSGSWKEEEISEKRLHKLKTMKYLENTVSDSDWSEYMSTHKSSLCIEEPRSLKIFPANLVALSTSTFRLCPTVQIDFAKLRDPPRMAVLKLTGYSDKCLPESMVRLASLKIFKIRGAKYLETLPASFGNLSALQSLKFKWCYKLQNLPYSFGNLSALQSLEFEYCSELQTLPNSFGNLSALQSLEFSSCDKLQTLPDSFGNLSALQSLKFQKCTKLQTFPDSFRNLSTLQSLKFKECYELRTLPDWFGNLSTLQSLEFNTCGLKLLPDSFGNLSTLQSLTFDNCQLQTLPDSIGNLSALQLLTFQGRGDLYGDLLYLPDSFGNLSSLQVLKFRGWFIKLQTLPECFGNLSTLLSLEVEDYESENLPDSFGNLSSLQSLKFWNCRKLQTLPDSFGNLSALQSLMFYSCGLETLPDSFGNLSALQSLMFGSCGLETLPDSFGNLSALQSLEFVWCKKLKTLRDSFGNLSTLQLLEFSMCNKLQTLPDSFGNLSALQTLKFQECSKLQTFPDSFQNLCTLQSLTFSEFYKLQTLPDWFGNLSALQSLKFWGCKKLQTLPDSFGNLSALQSLDFDSCEFETLPDSFGNLSALQSLKLSECHKLQTLPDSFGNLMTLQSLGFWRCSKLQTLPDSFGNLSALRTLKFIDCPELQTLPDSFGNLFPLQLLEFYGCSRLHTLPDSFGTLSTL